MTNWQKAVGWSKRDGWCTCLNYTTGTVLKVRQIVISLGKVPKTFLRNPSVKGLHPPPKKKKTLRIRGVTPPRLRTEIEKNFRQNRHFSPRKHSFWDIFQRILGLRIGGGYPLPPSFPDLFPKKNNLQIGG